MTKMVSIHFKNKLNHLILIASSIALAATIIWASLMFYNAFTQVISSL
jgi:hypothetical protein